MFLLRLKSIVFVAILVFLTQCTKMSEHHLQVNQALATPFTMPATAYLAMAKHQAGEERQGLLLMAAGRYTFDGQIKKGSKILSQIEPKSALQRDEKSILLAKIALIQHQPQQTTHLLANISALNALPLFYQAQYHELLAYAYSALGNRVDAINERIKLEGILPDDASRMNNRRVLWLSLATMPRADLNTLALEATPHSQAQGWLTLALIARENNISANRLFSEIQHWKESFPNHPGNAILPSPLEAIKPYLFTKPHQIGVLLPLSGPLSGPGNAIRDGILKAHTDYPITGVEVSFYDTAKANPALLYDKAVENGADYIIGPLTKQEVAAVASLPHPVPTLFLNETSNQNKVNTYQFGLSLPNEARQVAARARKDGHQHALVIAPAGAWGDEIVASFAKQWQANGGDVVDQLRFSDNENLNEAVRQVLHAPSMKNIKNNKASPLTKAQKRRRDIDMIFLLAYPSKARQIMPLLQYYYASDLPVYGTSTVYSGSPDSMKDRDLDGIIFCDMPWVFNTQMGSRHWPEQLNSYNRLFALGFDSYRLASQLNQLLMFPAMGVSEASGVLYLSQGQTVSRILTWGQFRQGLVQTFNTEG